MPDPKNPPRVAEPQAAYDPVAAGARATRQLEQSGFNRQQADAVVLAVRELAGDLATKEDLAITKSELKVEMAGLRTDLKTEMADLKTELKSEMADLRADLKTEMAGLRTEFKTEMAGLQTEFKTETAGLQTQLKSEMADLRIEFKTDLAHSETRMGQNALRNTLWTVGILLAGMGVVTAIILAALPS